MVIHEHVSGSVVLGSNQYRKKQIQALMQILANYAGFRSTSNLEQKLERVLRNTSDQILDQWMWQISNIRSRADLDSLVEDLTNHETYFFRDVTQFRVLKERLLPQHLSKRGQGKLRIWSAAGATGEEAFTLAILAAEYALENRMARWKFDGDLEFSPDFNIEVFGSDISRQAVRLAKDSVYGKFGLSSFRNMPENYWRFFVKQDPKLSLSSNQECQYFSPVPALRKFVSFDRHNLVEPLGSQFGKFDLIVCRNLFIYIDESSQRKIQKNFEEVLFKGGSMIFSAVDRLHEKKAFKEHWLGTSLVYQKK